MSHAEARQQTDGDPPMIRRNDQENEKERKEQDDAKDCNICNSLRKQQTAFSPK